MDLVLLSILNFPGFETVFRGSTCPSVLPSIGDNQPKQHILCMPKEEKAEETEESRAGCASYSHLLPPAR
jgi:hypothetical protein